MFQNFPDAADIKCHKIFYLSQLQKSKGLTNESINVRLQWDPDHAPNYEKEQRRAIQLGLKGEVSQEIRV